MYDHGADIYKYEKPVIDYSSNINILGVPDSFKESLIKGLDDFNRYPDYRYMALKTSISEFLGVDSKDLCVGNGSVELIYHVIATGSYKKVLLFAPTFSEYEKAAVAKGIPVDYYTLQEKTVDGHHLFSCDVEALLDKVEEGTLLVLCQPNNPTGSMLNTEELLALSQGVAKRKAHLLVDEAFIELSVHPEYSLIEHYKEMPHVIISRAATKYFGMPGLRLGYMVTSNKEVKKSVESSCLPWHVNTAAVLGKVIFQDKEYMDATRHYLNEINKMYENLREIKGIKVYKSNTIFHLVELEEEIDAYVLGDRLVEQGYLIRTPQGFKQISNKHFRVTVKDETSNNTFIETLERCVQ